ncbi:MAG TPA: CBS domain-containing protein [Bacteroidota bacterium]|nr:CBS domain-containing protein [Bacteroidota bacterium]
MNDEMLEDELSQMYEEGAKTKKTLDATTLHSPLKTLRVRKPVTMPPGSAVADAVDLMKKKNIGCILVTERGNVVGIFTERDVLNKIAGTKNADRLLLADVMTRHVESFQPDDSIAFVLNAMHVGGYRHVPVVDEGGTPVAVISVKDIIAFILEHFAEDVLNLPPSPVRKTTQREGA